MKPYLLYLFCACNAYLLVMHLIGGRRRVMFGLLLVSIVWLGLSYLLYDLGARGPMFPRHTIPVPLVVVLAVLMGVLTPGAWRRKAVDVTDNDFDSTLPTAPAPLEPKQPTVH